MVEQAELATHSCNVSQRQFDGGRNVIEDNEISPNNSNNGLYVKTRNVCDVVGDLWLLASSNPGRRYEVEVELPVKGNQ